MEIVQILLSLLVAYARRRVRVADGTDVDPAVVSHHFTKAANQSPEVGAKLVYVTEGVILQQLKGHSIVDVCKYNCRRSRRAHDRP